MKRFLLLFCAVVLVCSIMIVPALAAEYINSITVSDLGIELDSKVSVGTYTCTLWYYDNSTCYTAVSEPFVVGNYEKIYDDEGVFEGAYLQTAPIVFSFGEFREVTFRLDFFLIPNGESASDTLISSMGLYSPESDLYVDASSFTDLTLTLTLVEPASEASPIGSIFDVFGGVGSWIGNQLGSITSLFWNASSGSLTFLGVLSVCGLAFGLILLLVMLVVRFLRFRG